jgi:hypothetical protein
MMNMIRWLLAVAGGILAAYISALMWWRLWMYEGLRPAPPRYLHWFIWSDGEGSYNLIQAEMFGVCLLAGFGLWITVRLMKRRQNHAVVGTPLRAAPHR